MKAILILGQEITTLGRKTRIQLVEQSLSREDMQRRTVNIIILGMRLLRLCLNLLLNTVFHIEAFSRTLLSIIV